jgi:hypothetical protein
MNATRTVRGRNATAMSAVYAGSYPERSRALGEDAMQKAQPRDIGALALVVALFVVLFVLSVTLGTPPR